ncbi:MAG TPA: asparagine synthase (glutamine-hydrolyzing) [Gemmatimonadaceae bacterium]
MCGICGIAFSSRSGAEVQRSTIERMSDVIAHRGPDGAGVFVRGRIGLGHRRLSIVDPEAGQQPMAIHDGAVQIVYNGEVYNHPDIQRRLEADGHRYRTHCDTESILRLYDMHGAGVAERLRGMFAFAIWDSRKETLFIARDRFGIKPLYYALTADGSLYFGSEIKAILASGDIAARFDDTSLPEYLSSHSTFGAKTMYAGIRRLEPGHTLTWRDGQVTIERYWDLSFAHEGEDMRSDADIVAEYDARFREAVRMHLMADVPLGSFLSGGIDSAAITAVMSQLIDAPVRTFSVAFAERDANELQYARQVSKAFRTEHREIVVSPAEFWRALPRLIYHEDEPIAHPSSIPLHFVSRLAVENVKVVLTGEGSDEVLGGYNRYRATMYNMRFGRTFERAVPRAGRAMVRGLIESLPARSRVRQKLSRTFLTLPADITSLYFDNFAVFGRQRLDSLWSRDARQRLGALSPYATSEQYWNAGDAHTLLNKLLYVDTKTYLHELLMKQDQMSMAASIESRVPFLDHDLVEFAARMPERMKVRGLTTKYVLRQAMAKVLPPEILTRRKMGFPVPVGPWLRGPYRFVLDDFVLGPRARTRGLFDTKTLQRLVASHTSGEANHSERLWSLINLEMWQRMQFDGEAIEDVSRSLARPSPVSVAVPA